MCVCSITGGSSAVKVFARVVAESINPDGVIYSDKVKGLK